MSTQTTIQPLGDRVLVKPMKDEGEKTTKAGIIIPETVDKEAPQEGEVVAVGEGRFEDGKRIPMNVSVGDRIIFSKYGFDTIKQDDEEYYLVQESSVLAIVK